MTVPPIPDGYHAVTPWLIVRGAAPFLDFLTEAFGAVETARVPNPDGSIGHAEVRIGDSVVMLFDAGSGWPQTPGFLRLYVADGDAAYRRALDAGCSGVTEMTELSWGDRVGRVRDPWGNLWWIQTRIADVPPEELERRAAEPPYLDAMRYVQESLDRELKNRTRSS